MIGLLLPPEVRSAEAFDDLAPAPLFAAEEAVLTRAVESRRREFATARACARRALGELGLAPSAIPRGERGAPVWPDGVVGSITHCAGYRAAAVAPTGRVATIGIDAEPNLPLPEGVPRMVASTEERDHAADLARHDQAVCWDRLLFCAKEAVYKAWFPLTGRWLDFLEARVRIGVGGTFDARLLVPGPTVDGSAVDGFSGRWSASGGILLAVIAQLRRP